MFLIQLITISLYIWSCRSQQCNTISGFDFSHIAANNNYQAPWSNAGYPETISYAPCSGGVPKGCGTASPGNHVMGFQIVVRFVRVGWMMSERLELV